MNNKQHYLQIKHYNWQLFVVLLLSLMIFANPSYAQSAGDICKSKMIENINHGNFEDAIQNLKCVEDWTFDAEDDNDFLDIEKAVDFIFYADSTDLNRKTYHSFVLYFKDEMDFIGNYSYDKGDYKSAVEVLELSVMITKSFFGESHISYAETLNKLGKAYREKQDYKKAENSFLIAKDIYTSVYGNQHPNYAKLLDELGLLYYSKGEYAKAKRYSLDALEIQQSALGKQNVDYAFSLSNLGLIYHDLGDFKKAEAYYLEALQIHQSVHGERHRECAILLSSLGVLYRQIGDYTKSETCQLKAINIIESVLGKHHPNYAYFLVNLGSLYLSTGDYKKSITYNLEACEIIPLVLGEQNVFYANALNNLGIAYSKLDDYTQTEKYYLKTLKIIKDLLGERHPSYAAILNNLGGLYENMADYKEAEQYLLEALRIYMSILGERHIEYANSCNNLGGIYFKMDNYEKAEKYYSKALEIQKSIQGEQNPSYVLYLKNIGVLYKFMGDYHKAEACYLRALDIANLVLSKQHPDYVTLLNNLGVLYLETEDYEKAEDYLLRALAIQKSIAGELSSSYASILNNLGEMYCRKEDYITAADYHSRALLIREKLLGKRHPDYATSLNNLATIYYISGENAEAIKYQLKALNIQKSVFGENHTSYELSLQNLGRTYDVMGDYVNAERYFRQSRQIKKDRFIKSIRFMSEQQREKYWTTIKYSFEYTYPRFAHKYYADNLSLSTFAYDNELFIKGLLLNSSNAVRSSILESGDTTLIRQWNELTAKKQQIQVLEEKAPQSEYLKQVQTEAEQLEKQVTQSSAAFRESKARWAISWDSVRNHLADNEVAIEYFVAPLSEDTTMYCALLLRHDSEYPALVPLFEEKEVAALVNVSTGNQTNFTYSYDAYGEEICHRVWDKIQPYVREGETIYFSPAGLLHQLAIEALPYDENHTLADVYHLVRLSSTREIAMRHTASKHSTATLYGGIEYDMTDTELLAASNPYQQTNLLASRGIDNDTLNRGNVQYLEGTLHEVENIYSMLVGNRSHRIKAQLYKAKAGNEESFKSLSGKRQNILHIATHGFFWTDAVAQRKELFTQRSLMMSFDGNQHTSPTIDPLIRCGLLLAGANTALSGHSKDLPEGVQDGILTAKEISLMDLREADLVVLSACETGRGEITSEGVFGLQRAFKQAGVQTIVMSLWKVSDVATQLLMTEFYRNWLTLGQAKREAFRNAQNTVRQQYPNPEFWAGFVMID